MKAALLAGGTGLGTYVPAVYAAEQLTALGFATECFVLESFYPEAQLTKLKNFRRALRDPGRARVAAASAGLVQPRLAEAELHAMSDALLESAADIFLVFSGFWCPALTRLLARRRPAPPVVQCHVDAVVSPSWRAPLPAALELWAFELAERRVNYRFRHPGPAPLAWDARAPAVVLHGGGWHLGEMDSRIEVLTTAGWQVRYVTPEKEAAGAAGQVELLHLSEDWEPWDVAATRRSPLPEMHRATAAGVNSCSTLREHLQEACAIVSKPGGGTLIDSLAGQTPLLMLPAFGAHERANGELWAALGFGVWWDDWTAAGAPPAALAGAQARLAAHAAPLPLFSEVIVSLLEKHFQPDRLVP
jgi:hypothetical protein